jgi:hypothetical protein
MQVRQPVPRAGEVQPGTLAHVLAPGAKALIFMRWGNLGLPSCIGPGAPGFLDVSRPLVAS